MYIYIIKSECCQDKFAISVTIVKTALKICNLFLTAKYMFGFMPTERHISSIYFLYSWFYENRQVWERKNMCK